MANFQTIVANLGFPIAISLYLLVRIEGKLQALTDSINELYLVSDLLITDYSSVYFDYLNLNKPVIFINTDEDTYKDERGFIFDNEDMWRPGPKVKDMK